MFRVAACAALLSALWISPVQAQKRPIEVQDLFRFQRLADPQISPDGKLVVYQATTVNYDENKSSTNFWVAATDFKSPARQLTTTTKSDRHPRWSPDGSRILFESNRNGDMQLWAIDLHGGEARQLTHISTGAANGTWSPDGKRIAFVSAVYPEYSNQPFAKSDAANKQKLDAASKSPVKCKVFTRLFYRHWDEYVEDRRNHLFVMAAQGGEPLDVTPGDRDAYPTSTTFSVDDEFTFSPNSEWLVFTAVPARDEAWSTNYDICRVPVGGGKVETLTAANKAADGSPRFAPSGKKLAYRAQKRPGYEADRWEIMVVDCDESGAWQGKPVSVTPKFDASVDELVWGPDSKTLFLLADDNAGRPIFEVHLDDAEVKPVLKGGVLSSLSISRDGNTLAFTKASLDAPAYVAACRTSDPEHFRCISPIVDLLSRLDLPRPESVTVKVEGAQMQMWLLKPPGFDATKKWPAIYLVHGGPQSAWADSWSYRWNPEVWAAQGYVVAMPNPRGSVGFGQKFVDEISGDWGGKCYDDLMAGADYLEKLPYVDKERMAAAGGSFGGYMMNWFAVNTSRFKTLVSHCSVWNFESMWGTTDELWFDEFEHGGLPWDKPGAYAKFSPHKKAGNLGKYKTPMLLIQNDLDFRCPIGQGEELFSALQRQGVPSRMLNFPDEGHWVLKPKNSEYWHKEVFAWLKKYCPPGGK
jgi:dipeptidyl aminopeptidase/acylaminoacyl peptidase